ncbi:MAG: hypothetical protein [Microvirus sp.]|nr:MAG: hypothetical protein [Microvirus sp.]
MSHKQSASWAKKGRNNKYASSGGRGFINSVMRGGVRFI